MIDLDVRETDALFNALLRQIVTGDLTPKNIWLINQMLDMWANHQSWVLTQPTLLPQLLYTILSVMVDHFKPGFEALKDREVVLCLQILKGRANDVKVIGRDLIRLVQQVAYYPEFDDIWRDILTNKQSPIYFLEITKTRTSRLYFQLRSQPEMESLLLFIMKQVRNLNAWIGSQLIV
jgi:integrator complex subunit 3